MSFVDFPTWFLMSCYGGLAVCAVAMVITVLALMKKRRSGTRHLTGKVSSFLLVALLLGAALVWFYLRYGEVPEQLSLIEMMSVLALVVLCGWIIPLTIAVRSCFIKKAAPTPPASELALHERVPLAEKLLPPRHQAGVISPFVFSAEAPWGWLEYRSGNFQGQRLALKRVVATIGREEHCDIWLDDEMASRHHAELAWYDGRVCLTDCDSMNGTRLNSRRVRGTVLLCSQDSIEVGEHSFLFQMAERHIWTEDDPLTRHTWRSSQDLQPDISDAIKVSQGGPQTESKRALTGVTPPALSITHQPPSSAGITPPPLVAPTFMPPPVTVSDVPPTRPRGMPGPLKLPSRRKQ